MSRISRYKRYIRYIPVFTGVFGYRIGRLYRLYRLYRFLRGIAQEGVAQLARGVTADDVFAVALLLRPDAIRL